MSRNLKTAIMFTVAAVAFLLVSWMAATHAHGADDALLLFCSITATFAGAGALFTAIMAVVAFFDWCQEATP
jgi:type IV secretory pathway VirB2 component (pilin)